MINEKNPRTQEGSLLFLSPKKKGGAFLKAPPKNWAGNSFETLYMVMDVECLGFVPNEIKLFLRLFTAWNQRFGFCDWEGWGVT